MTESSDGSAATDMFAQKNRIKKRGLRKNGDLAFCVACTDRGTIKSEQVGQQDLKPDCDEEETAEQLRFSG